MKAYIQVVLLAVIALMFRQNVNAQDSADDQPSHWQADLGYLNDNVYLGRKDSVKIPYFTPALGYYCKSGFYVNGSLSVLSTSEATRIDLVSFEGGYSFTRKKLEGEISFSKLFYSSGSTSVQSTVKASADAYSAYDLGFIKPSLEASFDFSDKTDYALSFGLQHSFYALKEKMDITPGININASTQNSYGSYYKQRRYAGQRKRKGGGGLYYDISADLTNASSFKILDYEFSLPVNYTANKFTFNITPTLASPVNPAEVILTVKPSSGSTFTKTNTEKINDCFYWSMKVSYSF